LPIMLVCPQCGHLALTTLSNGNNEATRSGAMPAVVRKIRAQWEQRM
jgi:hypothetical protein